MMLAEYPVSLAGNEEPEVGNLRVTVRTVSRDSIGTCHNCRWRFCSEIGTRHQSFNLEELGFSSPSTIREVCATCEVFHGCDESYARLSFLLRALDPITNL